MGSVLKNVCYESYPSDSLWRCSMLTRFNPNKFFGIILHIRREDYVLYETRLRRVTTLSSTLAADNSNKPLFKVS